jgi:site-specific recombinase XerD
MMVFMICDFCHRGIDIMEKKDQKYHIKAFGASTCKAVKKYLSCLTDVKQDDPFWITLDGKALTYSGLREILRRLCAEAGIDMHHFHDFRRFYALELYNTTHDIYMVSRALDHKDIEVTKRYISLDERTNMEALRTYSPMDRQFRQTGIKVVK